MTEVSFTLRAVDVTNSVTGGTTSGHTVGQLGLATGPDLVPPSDAAVWWSCFGCGTDVELAARDSAGLVVPCPDCAGPLDELWRWEPVAA